MDKTYIYKLEIRLTVDPYDDPEEESVALDSSIQELAYEFGAVNPGDYTKIQILDQSGKILKHYEENYAGQ